MVVPIIEEIRAKGVIQTVRDRVEMLRERRLKGVRDRVQEIINRIRQRLGRPGGQTLTRETPTTLTPPQTPPRVGGKRAK